MVSYNSCYLLALLKKSMTQQKGDEETHFEFPNAVSQDGNTLIISI